MTIRAPESPGPVLTNAIAESVALGHVTANYVKPAVGGLAGLLRTLSRKVWPDVGGGAAQPRVEASKPLPVYSIPLKRLAELGQSALKEADLHGWRVFAGSGAEGQTIDVGGADWKRVAVRRGAYASMVAKASALAASVTPKQEDFEARLLDFGRLGMSALWLHNEESDRFFTLEPDPSEKSPAELFGAAQQRAQARFGASDLSGAAPARSALPDLGG